MYFTLLITVFITAAFLVVAAYVTAKLLGPVLTIRRKVNLTSVVFLPTARLGCRCTWATTCLQSFS